METSGVCKISDFGISKRTDDIDRNGHTAMQGSVFWMAPEVISPQKKGYNAKVDIWSVGCVILEMWAGERPWSEEEAVAVMLKVCAPSTRIHRVYFLTMPFSSTPINSPLRSPMMSSYPQPHLTSGINVSRRESPSHAMQKSP